MDEKKNRAQLRRQKLVALIARYGHMDSIITVAGIAAVAVLSLVVGIVLIVNTKKNELPANAVFDEAGNLTAVLGDYAVCLDPGHGYDDPGADSDYLGEAYAEREINLDVALRVRDILTGYGISVVMTHDTDTPDDTVPTDSEGLRTIDPVWRADFANAQDIDLYVSLHCDSYTADENVSGARIYYMPSAARGSDAASLARQCGKAIRAAVGGSEVATKPMSADDAYYVIKYVNVSSILIEMGFVTNPEDAANMLNGDWCQKMAEGISQGIINDILY